MLLDRGAQADAVDRVSSPMVALLASASGTVGGGYAVDWFGAALVYRCSAGMLTVVTLLYLRIARASRGQ